ncbi:hypothetical protein [Mycolicibacterium llatzerense]|uniref:hypothetical protein n=1 Tax=Mycolicibacterium llatzerense TaxID=280871 RepID=UPI0021B60C72|nr:hypothetical protein [Mycolicibacterium llatzerense]MCT7366523.1 hypothetical protein [Mycolicibacterium llatzerense]
MQNITIGRYKPSQHLIDTTVQLGPNAANMVVDIASLYDGWIEGVRDDGSTWIMWLDAHGSPQCFWAEREDSGAVVGEAVNLRRESDGTDQPS